MKTVIDQMKDVAVWERLGASEQDLKKRQRTLELFLKKISETKHTPKARKKPPQRIDTIYQSGGCLAFRYPSGLYGGAVIIRSEFYKNRGGMSLALTDIAMGITPNMIDFENAKLIDFNWEMVSGQAERLAAFTAEDGNKYTSRIYSNTYEYSDRDQREGYFWETKKYFELIGQFPAITQVLLGTSWTNTPILEIFEFYYLQAEKKSEQSLKELIPLLSK